MVGVRNVWPRMPADMEMEARTTIGVSRNFVNYYQITFNPYKLRDIMFDVIILKNLRELSQPLAYCRLGKYMSIGWDLEGGGSYPPKLC